ncbi:putative outer membrane protein [Paraburkholderia caballeronis]|uniref:Predicted outer membrane protein n=2 Tax=Paraburkholderia caballeronis TaxID=416943 RepID=A0A1H7J615_9BURK|nr:DUF4142 domain-containing protein [Paraburkholderia caballeronis]PXW27551.1 putative outer membrane protein [Paraburkholderia caballeronis]PXX03025.1 putative outer membrane protein [Paraburkholderia caballeronis]RAK03750.1 putative outer membrane protein [Paraburkholderia caballeronis]TDV21078.1 putative outer membrane protein [Paraburkholderia caballeronis]TDV21507.1 putative outer membrane protein [Paraburkholderia caballeronis]
MKMTTAVCVCALVAAPALHAQTATTEAASTTAANPLPAADRDFVQAASMASSTEIDAAKLAAKNTDNKDVRSFARKMMLDHAKLTVQLKMAAPHGVQVPKDNSDPAVLDALRPLKGAQFDQAYVQKVGLDGHKEAIAAFEKEIAEGQDASLKKAATGALPTIKEHYQMAQQLAQKVGVGQ